MRLFAALPLPPATLVALERLQDGLPEGRAVPPENLHVTLGFFDECDRHVAAEIDSALAAIGAAAFEFGFDGLGIFGGSAPRVLHAAIRPEPGLARLRAKVRRAARDAGIVLKRERFVPHVTLARFRPGEGRGERMGRWIAARMGFRHGPVPAVAFCLWRSDAGGGGRIYSELVRYPLGQ